jgi:transposase
MRALDPEVVDAVWAAVEGLLPRRADDHPLGCHRPRLSDRLCFEAMLVRLVTGCSWVDAERLTGNQVSDTTLRDRRDEWIAAGVFETLEAEALAGYDRIVGLDLADVAIDGALNKAPCGGEGTGKNPTDRGKLGWKWSIATESSGMVIGWVIDAANRNDIVLLEPTLDAVAGRGLVADIETLHLDKGYDSQGARALAAQHGIDDAVIGRRRARGQAEEEVRRPFNISRRWIVERTNSWLTNLGQLRRNTDRHPRHRRAQFALALALLTAAKLIDWRDRWAF